jgi:glycosyltransferase involved in cell wall biosynthesis
MISTGMHMSELAFALADLGWRIEVMCARPTLSETQHDAPTSSVHHGVSVRRVGAIGGHWSGLLSRAAFAISYSALTLFRVVRDGRNAKGILVTTNPPFVGIVGLFSSWFFRIPYVLIVYDVYPDIVVRLGVLGERSPVTRVWRWLTRTILNRAAATVVIGRDMAGLIEPRLKPANKSRMRLISNWSDTKSVWPVPPDQNPLRRHDGKLIVQYSGRMARTHNLEPLIGAAELLRAEPVIFQFIGEGAKKSQLQETARQGGLTNVEFLPYQPMERLAESLSSADLGVVCLATEFTGLSVPSKTYGLMAAATPILAFVDERSEIGLMLKERDCGFVLSDPTAQSVADVIRELLSSPCRRQAMAENGYRAFIDNYTLNRAAASYDAVLREAFLGEDRPQTPRMKSHSRRTTQ